MTRLERDTLPAADADFLRARVAELESELTTRQPGKYAFLQRHWALSYVRTHNHALFMQANAYAMQKLSTDDAMTYDDYVTRLEADLMEQDRLLVMRAQLVDSQNRTVNEQAQALSKQAAMLNAMNRTILEQSRELADLRAAAMETKG